MDCSATKVKACFQVFPRLIYICNADGTQTTLYEVLMTDSAGNIIPHGSTSYPVTQDGKNSGFVGNGDGFIHSYFANLDLTPIPEADEPAPGSYQLESCLDTYDIPRLDCSPGYRVVENGATWTPPAGTKSVTVQVIADDGTNNLVTPNGNGSMSAGTSKTWTSNDFGDTGFAGFSATAGTVGRLEIHFQVCV